MIRQSEEWGRCISELLGRHGLSWREAEKRCNAAVSSTYIGSMTRGKVPQYNTAVAFLGYFPRLEAIECLESVGYPVPNEWRPQMAPFSVDLLTMLQGEIKRQSGTDHYDEYSFDYDPVPLIECILGNVPFSDAQLNRIERAIRKHRERWVDDEPEDSA